MIDLKAKREENAKRLLGVDGEVKSVVPYVPADLINPEVCWNIISMAVRFKTASTVGKNGKTYIKATKELAFPQLATEVVVGEKATTSKNAKTASIMRTNLQTMRDMYEMRNKMTSFYTDDKSDDYVEYFESVIEILDGYACQVIADMFAADDKFLEKVNAARAEA